MESDRSSKRGRLIVLEGPSGSGKSTVASEVVRLLAARGRDVVATRQPSDTPFGLAVRALAGLDEAHPRPELPLRALEPSAGGRALALAVAADRQMHLDHVVEPALRSGHDVVCDRHLPSSLVLQRIDGVGVEDMLAMNAGVPAPDLVAYIAPPPEVLRQRLVDRGGMTRLEVDGGPALELEYYREALRILDSRGWSQLWLDGEGPPDRLATQVLGELDRLQGAMQSG